MNSNFRIIMVMVVLMSIGGTIYLKLLTQQQENMESVKIASGGHIVHFLPLDIAVAKGYFQDEGLNPKITYVRGGTATAQALISGQVDFSLNSIDHAFKAAVKGKDNLRMIVLLNQLPGMVLVANKKLHNEIRSIADLKGRPLGVTSKGSATHMVLASLLKKNGVNPKEVEIVSVGASTFPPALENSQIAGGITLEPFASILVEQGKAFVLADLTSLSDTRRIFGGPYNQAGVLTRQDILDQNPALAQKVVKILKRALAWINASTPEEIAASLPQEVVGTDLARYINTLKKLREFYSPNGRIDPAGVKIVYEAMVNSGVIKSESDILLLNKFYTNKLVEEVGMVRENIK